eukprot:11199623-Lingulodinium_polyedra.AAC.1
MAAWVGGWAGPAVAPRSWRGNSRSSWRAQGRRALALPGRFWIGRRHSTTYRPPPSYWCSGARASPVGSPVPSVQSTPPPGG